MAPESECRQTLRGDKLQSRATSPTAISLSGVSGTTREVMVFDIDIPFLVAAIVIDPENGSLKNHDGLRGHNMPRREGFNLGRKNLFSLNVSIQIRCFAFPQVVIALDPRLRR
jgi:hypothetical protein